MTLAWRREPDRDRHTGEQRAHHLPDRGRRLASALVPALLLGPLQEALANHIQQRHDQVLFLLIAPGDEPDTDHLAVAQPCLDRLHQGRLARPPAAEDADRESRFALHDGVGKRPSDWPEAESRVGRRHVEQQAGHGPTRHELTEAVRGDLCGRVTFDPGNRFQPAPLLLAQRIAQQQDLHLRETEQLSLEI